MSEQRAMPVQPPPLPTVSLFGHSVEVNLDSTIHLPSVHGAPELTIDVSQRACRDAGEFEDIYRSRFRGPDGSPVLSVLRDRGVEVLHFPRCAQFHIGMDRIGVHPYPGADQKTIDSRLFGVVMAYWLEKRGITTLHASAVAGTHGAVAFLAPKGGGKTTLAAAMMRGGHGLLTDDLLAIAPGPVPVAFPAYPQMRMSPELASHFFDDQRYPEMVHPRSDKLRIPVGEGCFGSFHKAPTTPVCAVYVPVRRGRGCAPATGEIQPAERLKYLLGNGFIPRLTHLVRDPGQRLGALAAIAENVSFRTVTCPDDRGQLDRVCALISSNLEEQQP